MPKGFQGRTIVYEAGTAAAPMHGPLVGALEAITRIAHEAPSVKVGMPRVLAALCAALDWPIGHVYQLAGEDPPTLTSAAIWHLDGPDRFVDFQAASEQIIFRPGRGLVGQVLARCRPGVSPDVSRDARFLRRRVAEAAGVRGWLAFPIVASGRVVAVCECFTTERAALDPSAAGVLSCAGLTLGHLYEREHWLAEREALLQQLAAAPLAAGDSTTAALSALAGAVAHEINSPLFAARASLALLAAERPDEPLLASAQADLARIAAALEQLHALAQSAPLGQRLDAFVAPQTA